MRILSIGALLLVAGCASLANDLQAARAKCPETTAAAPFIACLNQAEEPVFQKDSPRDVPAYRDFAAARLGLAEELDGGKITPAQFSAAAAQARAKFTAATTGMARAREAELEKKREEDAVENLQGGNRPGSGASMGDMGMGGMGNMGMGM